MNQNPLSAYKETKIKTAGPGQLIIMLYDEAVKQCDIALEYLAPGQVKKASNIEKINNSLGKVRDIITELMASLDFEAGGDIAKDLFSLYVYFNSELMEANLSKDAGKVKAVRGYLDELRGAWVVAASQSQGAGTERGAGVNIAG